ncbi:CbiX/SirB N-terminal domain-containing protein [uncultured Thiothrix sp.]|uniref:sirohydrochlorin chelatase n=1 Tax=uncultured Thiothrix sp. TaxID=223185 RepID=UPI00261452A8|nr:CbiX/SirB N-terminal domain-containing protein [uncultured Thiothrix sp.]HMT92730.1 CbiX/SirB N-terminal domain-containing protein [Thiolinea sp.]
MRSLILIAHGSRRETSNEEVRALAAKLASMSHRFDSVTCAFLELAEPSIPNGIEACVQQGAKDIVILPYFLSAGRHVVEDIPALVQPKQAQYPELNIELKSYLGAAESLPALLMALVD